MMHVRRLLAVGAILAGAAILITANVRAHPGRDQELRDWRKGDGKSINPAKDEGPSADDERNRFADLPVVIYDTAGESLFGLQLQPKLPDAPALPKDYLVVVDTSASKAMGPLAVALQITEELSKALGAGDRMAIWTANIKPKDVSRGFKSGKALEDAVKDLGKELPLGAVNLKRTLTDALASFEVKAGRQRVVVYLGDGMSVADPLDVDGRADLCDVMVKKQAAFFAVPTGTRFDSQNLHGLVAGTGGKCVRFSLLDKAGVFVARLRQDIAQPILYTESFKLPETVKEAMPTKLPPLRRDTPTLVVGKLQPGTKKLDVTLAGEVAGKAFRAEVSHKVPSTDSDYFFLSQVFQQWKKRKDLPTLLPADRALAYAFKQNQLAVEDLLAKGEMCLEQNRIDAAQKLFEQAQQLAPDSVPAKGGLVLVEKMRSGKHSRDEMLKELRVNAAKREMLRLEGGKRKVVVLGDGDEKKDDPKDAPRDPLADVKMRKQIAEQQANLLVNEAVRQANRLVRTNPDEAYTLLKQTLDGVRGNTDLDPRSIVSLSDRLNRAMQSVRRQGDIVKRDQAEALALRAAADARLDLRRAETLAQDRIRERMRVFRNLMDQAREDEAYRQALAIRNDLVSQGQPVPPSVTSAYITGINGYHLREVNEVRRLKEEAFLATLLEVDRSSVPFPDEPPVLFPSSAIIKRMTQGQFDNWRDFSKYRIGRYGHTEFGANAPAKMFELKDLLNKTVDFSGFDDPKTTLLEALDALSKFYRVTFDINEKAIKFEAPGVDILSTRVAEQPIPPLKTSFGTVLKRVLSRAPVPSGLTYLIRRDVIEITTGQAASAEKAIRVYPAADLVIPIPNAFNAQQVAGQATILGTLGALGIVGQTLGAGGGFGALGALGGGLGALGGGLGALGLGGGLGALGGGLGALGLGGGGAGGLAGGLGQAGGPAGLQAGGFGFQGNQNLGVGGGIAGFQGGQLGQFGNLGGQFGLQGGDQSQLLITLIRQVVGRPKDWVPQYNPITGQPINPLDDTAGEGGALSQDNNNLGYYPPVLALVVKAPSRIHTRESTLNFTPAAGAGPVVANPRERDGRVIVDGSRRKTDVAGAGGEKKDDVKKPIQQHDPKEIWQDALAKSATEPGLIIATADYLAMNTKFDHCAEFLKANIRQGLVVKPWVYKSLAIALRESGGSAEDIERAEVSAADLEPLDSSGYLIAARALAEDKNYERALAFCKQAAELEPGVPHAYADAARYAEMAKDVKAMQWATTALLKQDWPTRGQEVQDTAIEKLDSLARQLGKAEGDRLRKAVFEQRRRDLVVKLLWQGEADLDLKIEEPSGSICTPLAKQTIGGGTLLADSLANPTSETYAAAEAFSGEYRVSVEKVWGKPLGGKAQLKIIRHQGTPRETEELVTVKMLSNVSEPIVVKLDGGRRTETAFVPPAEAHAPQRDAAAPVDTATEVFNKLRQLSDPEITGVERGNRGDVNSAGRPVARPMQVTPKSHESDRTVYQNKVQSFVANSVDLTAQAVLSADRRSIQLSLKPTFNTATNKPVEVVSPIFPGAPGR